jgi:hypothetical protein
MLQRGLMWGIGRLAGARPELMRRKNTGRYLLPYLDSEYPEVRGRAVWALGQLGGKSPKEIRKLLGDKAEVTVYEHPELKRYTIGQLAEKVVD